MMPYPDESGMEMTCGSDERLMYEVLHSGLETLELLKSAIEGGHRILVFSQFTSMLAILEHRLTDADVVVHYDPWWNLAVQNQATDRAHRIGQTKKVVVYKLIVKNSIEEKIQKLQEDKKSLSEQVIQGDVNALSSMSRDDFLNLLEG